MAIKKQTKKKSRNALAPTGPRTLKGKARAAKNSLKHGLLSKDVLMEGESRKELNAFQGALIADLAPEGELECLLADRVVASAWRLRRANRLERDVVEQLLDEARDRTLLYGAAAWTALEMAASTLHESDTYGKLARYEAHIERGMYRALHELQRLQAVRQGQQVTPPLVVDVDVHAAPLTEAPVTIDVAAAARDDA